jgi:hypothetical protein
MQEHIGTRPQWPQRKPDGTTERQRRWTPAWVIVTGAMMALGGYALGQTTILVAYTGGRTVSQVNGICTSALGQLGQALSIKASQNCGQVATYEQAHGWLIILGTIAIAAGIAWSVRRKQGAA